MATTDLVPVSSYAALTHNTAEFREIAADLGDISEFDLPRITLPSGKATKYRFEVPTLEGSETVDELRGIIVMQKRARQFWPLSIDEGGGNTPPACSSSDALYGTGKQWASKEDPEPEGEPRTLACADCPNAQWGSGKDGRGQACKESVSLFMLLPDGAPGAGLLPVIISVPPTSLKKLRPYRVAILNANLTLGQVETVLTLGKATSAGVEHAIIEPRLGAPLDPDAAARAREYGKALAPVFERAATTPPATSAATE